MSAGTRDVAGNACPSSFALDAFRLGLDAAPADHVAGCPRCTAWLAAQARLETQVAPLWGARLHDSRPARLRGRRLLRLGAPVALAAAAVILFLARPRPQPPTETAKGPVPMVQLARARSGVVSWLAPGDGVAPGDALRFVFGRKDVGDRYVLVGSVDGSGQLARFYPAAADGCAVALPAGDEPLGGSIVVDEAPGPERIVVLVSHQPLCWPVVGAALSRFALDGDGALPPELLGADRHAARWVLPKATSAER